MSKPQPFASPDFVEVDLWNHGEVAYPVESGGRVVIGDGQVKLRYRLDFDHGGKPERIAEGGVNVACVHRVADAAGAVWEARTCFRSDLFVNHLLDLNSLDWPMWAHNAPERVHAIAERPLLTGLYVVEDDRFYRRIWVNDALLEIQFKYQGLTLDVGYEDDSRVAVRVGGFFGSWAHVPMEDECTVPIWKGGTLRSPVADRAGKEYDPADPEEPEPECLPGGWLNNLAPITYSLWNSEFLFRNDAGWDRGEYPTAVPFPRPVVFRRVEGEQAEPNANVAFRT
jgi:hypothetical protein